MGTPELRLRITASKGDELQSVTDVAYIAINDCAPEMPTWAYRIESLLEAGCSVTLSTVLTPAVRDRTEVRKYRD